MFQLYINIPTPDMFMFHAWFEIKFWVNSVQVSQIEATSNSAICQDSPHNISHRHGANRRMQLTYTLCTWPLCGWARWPRGCTSRQKCLYLLITQLLYIFYQNHLAVIIYFWFHTIQCKYFLILWDVIFRHYHNSSLSLTL